MNPIANLAHVEANMAASINAAAAEANKIATSNIDEAMQNLKIAIDGAKARIASAKASLYSMVADLIGNMAEFATDNSDAIKANVVPTPAPEALPAPSPAPKVEEKEEVISLDDESAAPVEEAPASIVRVEGEKVEFGEPIVATAANPPVLPDDLPARDEDAHPVGKKIHRPNTRVSTKKRH